MKLRRVNISQISHKHKRFFKLAIFAYSSMLLIVGASLGAAFSNCPFPNSPFFSNSPFPGGWEFTGCNDKTTIADVTVDRYGVHSLTVDVDGKFSAGQGIYPAAYNKPGITIQTSYPYYIQRLSDGSWVQSDQAFRLDTYNVTLVNNATLRRIQVYYQWVIGFDITIQTDAASYYKPMGGYLDYGYWFESDAVPVDELASIAASPWTPADSSGNWTSDGGWNGIMSVSVYAEQCGYCGDWNGVPAAGRANSGYIMQNRNAIRSAVNMYTNGQSFSPADFRNSAALAGIPHSVDVEVGARISADAEFENDYLSHTYDLTVHNTFVEYKLRIDLLSTEIWALHLGHQGSMEAPPENNTPARPQLTWWDSLFEGVRQLFYSPGFSVLLLVLAFGGVLIVIFYVRGRGKGVRIEVNSNQSKKGGRKH